MYALQLWVPRQVSYYEELIFMQNYSPSEF